jgi:hypothetical protein
MRRHSELRMFLGAYVLYNAGRWLTAGDMGTAVDNAHWIVRTEQHLGVAVEHSVQNGLQTGVTMWLLSHIYLAAQFVVLPGALVYLYRRSPAVYRRLRDTVLATWLISIPVYAAFPVAPPRLAHIGLVDTITSETGFALNSKLTTSFYNQLAAVPSLHVGFAVVVSIAIAAAARRPVVKAIALLWGPAIALAVVATGNHYIFDIAAGLLASALGYAAGRVLRRVNAPRPRPVPALRPTFAQT